MGNGEPRTFFKRFKFVVEIDGLAYAGFEKAGPLESETATVEAWEGGGIIAAAKDPGRVSFPDLVLARGATRDEDLWKWYKQVSDASKDAGDVSPKYKKNLDIVQQDRDGTTLARWRVYNAWPKRFKAGDWDNTADENVVEEVTLVFSRFDRMAA